MKFAYYVGYFLNPKNRKRFTVLAAVTTPITAYVLLDELRKSDSSVELLSGYDVHGRELFDETGGRIEPQ